MTPAQIIDSAVRLPTKNGKIEAKEWFDLAQEWGISHSVAAPPDEFVAVYNDEGNSQMAELVKKHPDRLYGLAVANPWYGKKAVDSLKKAFDKGLSGLYLHPGRQGFHLSEQVVNPLIEVCIKYDKPIYAYTGTPVCAMPLQLAELARRFPKATFIMGHMAWSDFCGYDAIPAARQAPNIYIETSCPGGQTIKAAIDSLGAERILFGSGYPRSHPRHEVEKIKLLNLPEDAFNKITRENAIRVWKM